MIRFGTDKSVDWPYLSSALLLALAPLSWAFYAVLGRRLPAEADPIDTSYALLFVGSLPLLAFARPSTAAKLASSPGALGAALYLYASAASPAETQLIVPFFKQVTI